MPLRKELGVTEEQVNITITSFMVYEAGIRSQTGISEPVKVIEIIIGGE